MFKPNIRTKIIIPVLLFALFFSVTEATIIHLFGNSQTLLLGVLGTVCLLALAFTLILIHTFITQRLMHLSSNLDEVKDPKNPAARLEIEGNDEFSEVAKKVNLILDESEKFKLAIENSLDLVVMTDADLKIIYMNKYGLQQIGYAMEELVGQTPLLWHEEADFAKAKQTVVDEKKMYKGELTNKRKNGEAYPAEINVTPILDKDNQVKFYVRVEHDISANKQLKESLIMENQQIAQQIQEQTRAIEDEKAKLLSLINSISLGFLMFDPNGRVMFTNPAVERITNLKLDSSDVDAVDAALGKEFAIKEKFQTCLQEKQQVVVREVLFNKKYLRLIVTPIFSSKELMALIGVAILFEDNTEAKMAERSASFSGSS